MAPIAGRAALPPQQRRRKRDATQRRRIPLGGVGEDRKRNIQAGRCRRDQLRCRPASQHRPVSGGSGDKTSPRPVPADRSPETVGRRLGQPRQSIQPFRVAQQLRIRKRGELIPRTERETGRRRRVTHGRTLGVRGRRRGPERGVGAGGNVLGRMERREAGRRIPVRVGAFIRVDARKGPRLHAHKSRGGARQPKRNR